MQLSFIYDVSKCIGCMACVQACQEENALQEHHSNIKLVTANDSSVYLQHSISFVSTACSFCVEAPCIENCPENALYRRSEDNLVLVNHDDCIGCGLCQEVCPYEGSGFNPNGRMAKCYFCVEDLEIGESPVCSQVCKTQALRFGALDHMFYEGQSRSEISCSDDFEDHSALEQV